MIPTELQRDCEVDIALRWGTGYDTVFKSFVNIISTPKGGTHQAGFEQGMLKFLRAEAEKSSRRLKLGNDKLEKDEADRAVVRALSQWHFNDGPSGRTVETEVEFKLEK